MCSKNGRRDVAEQQAPVEQMSPRAAAQQGRGAGEPGNNVATWGLPPRGAQNDALEIDLGPNLPPRAGARNRRGRDANGHRAKLYTPLRPAKVNSIDYTPQAQPDIDRFKYSCPLCFCYFSETILTTSCCNNYICYGCALEHARHKKLIPETASVLPEKLKNAPCPHCNTAGVQLSYVSSSATVRHYDTSPATKLLLERLESVAEPEKPGKDTPEALASSNIKSIRGRDSSPASESTVEDSSSDLPLATDDGMPTVTSSGNNTPQQ